VGKIDPDLVARDDQGRRYEEVNAMLLNEFLKEHRHVRDPRATVTKQQRQISALPAALKAQAAQIQG
jgi:hypothetical protein